MSFTPTTSQNRLYNQMALELVARLEPPEDVLTRYGVSGTEFAELCRSEMFRTMLREAQRFWHSAANSKGRIEAKARMCVEDSLHVLYSIAHDEDTTPPTRIDAVARLARIAGVDTPAQESAGTASGFRVNIYLGGEQPISIDTGTGSGGQENAMQERSDEMKTIDHDEAA